MLIHQTITFFYFLRHLSLTKPDTIQTPWQSISLRNLTTFTYAAQQSENRGSDDLARRQTVVPGTRGRRCGRLDRWTDHPQGRAYHRASGIMINDYITAPVSEPYTAIDPIVQVEQTPLKIPRSSASPEATSKPGTELLSAKLTEMDWLTGENAEITASINDYKLRLKNHRKPAFTKLFL